MRRFQLALLLSLAAAVLATPAAAARPSASCGADASGWHAVTLDEWVTTTEEATGVDMTPEEEQALKDYLTAVLDKNADEILCMKDFQPVTTSSPQWDPGMFNAKDNTANRD